MRGGPRPPSVLDDYSPTSLLNLPWKGLRPLLRRLRVCRRGFGPLPFGRVLAYFFAFFSLVLRILSQRRFLHRYFSIFWRFWEDSGWIWEGFWKVFSIIFLISLENADFVKYSVFPWENHYFSYAGLLKNYGKSTKHPWKIWANFQWGKEGHEMP